MEPSVPVHSLATPNSSANRWGTATQFLHYVRRNTHSRRSDVTRFLELSSSSATELSSRLRRAHLITEDPTTASGPGRPSRIIAPHPLGPVVAAVEVSTRGWRLAIAEVTGPPQQLHHAPLPTLPGIFLDELSGHIAHLREVFGTRLMAVSVSVPATVRQGRFAEPFSLGWDALDFSPILEEFTSLPIYVENNATLAALIESEAMHGDSTCSRAVLYLEITENVGGSFLIDGTTVVGGTGTSGEFGHMALGDDSLGCRCGSVGCWGTSVSGYGIAHRLRDPEPEDPAGYLSNLLDLCFAESLDFASQAPVTPAVREPNDDTVRRIAAVREAADRFGRGTAALCNALAPDVIILGGLAASLQRANSQAFDEAFDRHLMNARRIQPPLIRYAQCGPDAALMGAALLALDNTLDERGIAAWTRAHSSQP